MSVKSDILKILEQNRSNPISGEVIATTLGVSRAYVWKSIHKLQEEGYQITATPNLGYTLASSTDVISVEGIGQWLKPIYANSPIQVYKTIDSTNNEAKKQSVHGMSHGTIIISEEQTAGRGRRGRSFYSPKSQGIYMSFILKPEINVQDIVLITTAASVAVSRAIKKVTGLDVLIKWVNDLYLEGKKVCGILTEAVTDCETGLIDSLILGIGINFVLDAADLPMELRKIAGGLYEEKPLKVTRNMLCAQIINEVFDICKNLTNRDFLSEYKEKSFILGEKIMVIGQDAEIPAVAIDIDQNGGLIVEYEDGKRITLNSGEISIRKYADYMKS